MNTVNTLHSNKSFFLKGLHQLGWRLHKGVKSLASFSRARAGVIRSRIPFWKIKYYFPERYVEYHLFSSHHFLKPNVYGQRKQYFPNITTHMSIFGILLFITSYRQHANLSNICNDLENSSYHSADIARRDAPMTTMIFGEEWYGRVKWPRLWSQNKEPPRQSYPISSVPMISTRNDALKRGQREQRRKYRT